MRALTATGDQNSLVELSDVPEPSALPGEVVVEVEATSVNHGEVEWLSQAAPGWRPGWDIAGRVVGAAADGSGPPVGTRIAAFLPAGAWGERVAVPASRVGPLPEDLAAERAAAIPVAGLTALRALRASGLPAGRRVIVTGASGVIGRLATQLAARADAAVTALVRDAAWTDELRGLGAADVVTEPVELEGPFDAVLDGVGGAALGAALSLLAPHATVVLYGDASHEPAQLESGAIFLVAPEARIHALRMDASLPQDGFAADLAHLAALVAGGALDLGEADAVSWRQAAELVTASLASRPAAKPILRMD